MTIKQVDVDYNAQQRGDKTKINNTDVDLSAYIQRHIAGRIPISNEIRVSIHKIVNAFR